MLGNRIIMLVVFYGAHIQSNIYVYIYSEHGVELRERESERGPNSGTSGV